MMSSAGQLWMHSTDYNGKNLLCDTTIACEESDQIIDSVSLSSSLILTCILDYNVSVMNRSGAVTSTL